MNPLCFTAALAVGVLGVTAVQRMPLQAIRRHIEKHFTILGIAFGCLLLLLQAFLINQIAFTSDWDIRVLCWAAADPERMTWYISRYPNQLLLSALYRVAYLTCGALGIGDYYLALCVFGALCTSTGVVLAGFAARKIGTAGLGLFVFLVGGVYIGLSPWIAVAYSDAFAVLFPSAALFFYTHIKNTPLRIFFVTLSGCLGYLIKPTAVFCLIAIAAVGATFNWRRWLQEAKGFARHPSAQTCAAIAKCAIALLLALCFALTAKQAAAFLEPEQDESASFSYAHFLMMGFNQNTLGGYSRDDVNFSGSFADAEERKAANLAEWQARVSKMGPRGTLALLAKKTLTNYGDGTFAWAREGTFFIETPHADTLLAKYYGEDGTQTSFEILSQIVWFFVLIGICCNWIRRPKSKSEYAIMCSLMLLSIFLMLFEARARYLFLFAPYYVLLAGLGWRQALSAAEGALRR